MADAIERITFVDGTTYINAAIVAAREERYDARIDALTDELRQAREAVARAEAKAREASATRRALEIVLSRCKLNDATARELKYHLASERGRTGESQ